MLAVNTCQKPSAKEIPRTLLLPAGSLHIHRTMHAVGMGASQAPGRIIVSTLLPEERRAPHSSPSIHYSSSILQGEGPSKGLSLTSAQIKGTQPFGDTYHAEVATLLQPPTPLANPGYKAKGPVACNVAVLALTFDLLRSFSTCCQGACQILQVPEQRTVVGPKPKKPRR